MGHHFDVGPGLGCDLSALVDSRLLVQANSGGGKSFLLRRLLEQTHGHVQQLVIDPEGEFFTLREQFDYVLAAREGGDTVADPRSAKLLAERLLELGVSAVLDIYELRAQERIRFVRLFLEALVNAPKRLWHPVLVVVDEAHIFCPQVGQAESAGAVIDLATRGRKRGFCAVLATQRLSKLHKDAAAECNNKLLGRTGLDVDMKRVADELGFSGRDVVHSLRTLTPGQFYAFGPALCPAPDLVQVGPIRTSHPKAGARIATAPPPPTAKVKKLLPQLSDLPAEAASRQRTLEELERELAKARRELTLARKGGVTEVREKLVEKRVEVPVLKEGQLARLETLEERVAAAAHALGEVARATLQPVLQVMGARGSNAAPAVSRSRLPVSPKPGIVPASRGSVPRRPPTEPSQGVTVPQQRILDALAWLEAVGILHPSRAQLALWSDVSPTSGGYFNNLGALRSAGLVDYPAGGVVALTDAGRQAAQPSAPPTVEQVQAALCTKVGAAKAAILHHLIAIYPDEISRQDLAGAIGVSPTSGGYFNNLGALRTLGVIEYPRPNYVVAQPVLFLESS